MRYSLRTLMICMAIAGPAILVMWRLGAALPLVLCTLVYYGLALVAAIQFDRWIAIGSTPDDREANVPRFGCASQIVATMGLLTILMIAVLVLFVAPFDAGR